MKYVGAGTCQMGIQVRQITNNWGVDEAEQSVSNETFANHIDAIRTGPQDRSGYTGNVWIDWNTTSDTAYPTDPKAP